MEFLLTVIVVITYSIIYRWICNRIFTSGTLKIDRMNPEKDVYRIELDSLDNLHKKKRIVLKIDPNADLSQE